METFIKILIVVLVTLFFTYSVIGTDSNVEQIIVKVPQEMTKRISMVVRFITMLLILIILIYSIGCM